jgi:hypothetical protein
MSVFWFVGNLWLLQNLFPVDKQFEGGKGEKEELYAMQGAGVDATQAQASVAPAATASAALPVPAFGMGNHILSEEELRALEAAESKENEDGGMGSAVNFAGSGNLKGGAASAPMPAPPGPITPSVPPASSAMNMSMSTSMTISSTSFSAGPSGSGSAAAMEIVDAEMTLGKTGGAGAFGAGGGMGSGSRDRASLTYVHSSVTASAGMSAVGGGVGSSSSAVGEAVAEPILAAAVTAATVGSASSSGAVVAGGGSSSSSSNMVLDNANKVRQFHPACQAAAQMEVKLAMSQLFHGSFKGIDVPNRLGDETGTCKVQLLRSIGKWSTGTKTECSIHKCYIETILNAKHFIYIENQFFVSNTSVGADGVFNGIVHALVSRILAAYNAKQNFRVVIIIPMHPNGDYCTALKAKVVMHYEYATINRGMHSMFEQLRREAPGMNIRDYVGFYSLRSWGVINNKVVSDQVYVHDKLLIVDDRVAIIGSANINDRSMLGNRDSELAIRIEDTLHCSTNMNGVPFTVGFMPHTLRVKLMKQHLGADDSAGSFSCYAS